MVAGLAVTVVSGVGVADNEVSTAICHSVAEPFSVQLRVMEELVLPVLVRLVTGGQEGM